MPSPIPKFLVTVSGDKTHLENGPMFVSPGTGVFSFAGDSRTGKVGLWDLKSGESMVQHELKNDDKPTCVATAFDSGKGAFGTESGEIFIWDVCFPAVLESFKSGLPDANKDPVTSLSWHPRGHVLAAGSESGVLTVWDMVLGSPAFQTSHGSKITDVKWSAHGRQVISVGTDNELKVWNSRRGEIDGVIDGKDGKWHDGGIACMDTLPDLSRVALTGGVDGTAFLSVLKPNEKEGLGQFSELPKHTDAISAVVMGPLECTKPLRCATASKDNTVRLFDMEMKIQMGMFAHGGEDGDGVSQLEFNHNGEVLFSAADNSVVAWDSRAVKEEAPEVKFETDSKVTSFCIANDGASIIIGCDDSKLRCFDMRYPVGNVPGLPSLNSLSI